MATTPTIAAAAATGRNQSTVGISLAAGDRAALRSISRSGTGGGVIPSIIVATAERIRASLYIRMNPLKGRLRIEL